MSINIINKNIHNYENNKTCMYKYTQIALITFNESKLTYELYKYYTHVKTLLQERNV